MGLLSLWVVLVFTSFVSVDGDCGGKNQGKEIAEILIWSGGSWCGFMTEDILKTPNYLGHEVNKCKTFIFRTLIFVLEATWNCQVDCRYTGDKKRIGNVDAVIMEAQPIASNPNLKIYYVNFEKITLITTKDLPLSSP
jgi:hypothetical protein